MIFFLIRLFCCSFLFLPSISCAHVETIYLQLGENIGKFVQSRILEHLSQITTVHHVFDFSEVNETANNVLLISLGNTSTFDHYLNLCDFKMLPPEGYVLIEDIYLFSSSFSSFSPDSSSPSHPILLSNGKPIPDHVHANSTINKEDIHYGAVVGAYATLEFLGFAFLHPLSPYRPSKISTNFSKSSSSSSSSTSSSSLPKIFKDSPYWPDRNFHIHTQHPLELNEVLQGMDIPMNGPLHHNCSAYHKTSDPGQHQGSYCERWEDMVPNVVSLFEWCVANKLNKIEWMLLGNYKWGLFDSSDLRKKRLKVITSLGHQFGLLIGADVTLGNVQQHAWYMVNPRLPFRKQVKQIHKRVDWIFDAGFDFLSTESGMTEFTHPDCSLMLDLLNEYATYVNITWGREAAVKVHCSTGQTCPDLADPRTGEPINFNFLPYYAHSSLGVMPHTVQMYGLDDPIGGAYGNKNFKDIEDYMYLEASLGNRSVVYYGETSYWVSVDIDVPLFLPLYGQRRLHDLRRIATRERRGNFKIQGQMNFDSGWEWGYWLNDVITARASWDPVMNLYDEQDSDCETHDWIAFERSLQPFIRIFGEEIGLEVQEFLISLTKIQLDLLIYGRIKGKESPSIEKLSGIAYLSGSDTWYDLPRMFGLKFTQPDKVHLDETSHPLYDQALELLREMDEQFSHAKNQFIQILSHANNSLNSCISLSNDDKRYLDPHSYPLLDEIHDAIQLLSMRAHHVRLLYESKQMNTSEEMVATLQGLARRVLINASKVVHHREQYYRVPWQRIASWRENPTVYRFGYLWAVHSLYYWWRDQGLSERGSLQSQLSPCYLNRMDASEVAVGWGKRALEILRYLINTYSPFSTGYPLEIVNCIAPPAKEYVFPRDLFHH